MTTPEAVHPLVKKVFDAKPPIAQLIGFAVEEISRGRAGAVLEAGPQHANPMGTLHGGVLCDLADAAMGMAFAATLEHDESFTTINLAMNFLRPVWTARLRAEAHVVSRGKKVGYLEVRSPKRAANRSPKRAQLVSFYVANNRNSDDRVGNAVRRIESKLILSTSLVLEWNVIF